MIIRVPLSRMHLYKPALVGKLEQRVVTRLIVAVETSRALTALEKRALRVGLASISA